ncbi:MAG: polymer-forming cytoskeletal protein [Acidobacteriota bacterium]
MRPPTTPSMEPPLAAPAAPKPSEHEIPRGVAAIGKSVVVKGQIFSREDLYLDGEIEGTVEVPEHRLTVGPHGRLQAGIKAREVVVLGSVNGNVEVAERIDIRKEARLVGDIRTSRITIEDGAYFKGSIDIVREAAKPAPPPARPQPPPPAASATPPARPQPPPPAAGATPPAPAAPPLLDLKR